MRCAALRLAPRSRRAAPRLARRPHWLPGAAAARAPGAAAAAHGLAAPQLQRQRGPSQGLPQTTGLPQRRSPAEAHTHGRRQRMARQPPGDVAAIPAAAPVRARRLPGARAHGAAPRRSRGRAGALHRRAAERQPAASRAAARAGAPRAGAAAPPRGRAAAPPAPACEACGLAAAVIEACACCAAAASRLAGGAQHRARQALPVWPCMPGTALAEAGATPLSLAGISAPHIPGL